MKLYISATSPYARKCRALILEKGLDGRIQIEETLPLDNSSKLQASNPLGKVPALQRDRGSALMDSPLICEYLDSLNDLNWIPAAGESRILVLRQQAMADGMIDLTIGRRIEMTREETLQWDFWTDRWAAGIERTLDLLNAERAQFERSVDLGAMSIAIALGYLDLRYADLDWRGRWPELGAFAERWFERESFKRTAPPTEV